MDFAVHGVPSAVVSALLRSWRGRLFILSCMGVRKTEIFSLPGKAIPVADLEIYDRRDGGESLVRFHGGVGAYRGFTHLDTRGIDVDWSG